MLPVQFFQEPREARFLKKLGWLTKPFQIQLRDARHNWNISHKAAHGRLCEKPLKHLSVNQEKLDRVWARSAITLNLP